MVSNPTSITTKRTIISQIIEYTHPPHRKKRQRNMAIEIHVLAWSRLQKVAWLKLLMGPEPAPLYNLMSNDNKNIYKQYKQI